MRSVKPQESGHRTDEEHIIHVFGAADITAMLRGAGFSVRRLRGYGEMKVLPGRSVYIARKTLSTDLPHSFLQAPQDRHLPFAADDVHG